MVSPGNELSGQGAGWVVAAIVAVVAVCAVSFMIMQRPGEAMAVASGDPLTGETPRETQASATASADSPPPLRAKIAPARAAPSEGTAVAPRSAFDASAAASNAAAVETER